jgi:hypothetical protein
MEALQDLWPALTGALYEWRIALIVATLVGGVLLLGIAWRRGWFAAAKRHPARFAIAGVTVLIVAVPLAWYLASPVFIRTELDEPAPAAVPVAASSAAPVASTAPAATSTPSSVRSIEPTPSPTTTPTPTATPFAPLAIVSGEFHGSDEFHFGRGTATVIEVEPGRFHLRLEDFSVRNGPDLYVYLSPSAKGYAKGALELGTLKATDGSFGYDLPAGTDPADFASAVIWCKQFSHLFATAPFGDG